MASPTSLSNNEYVAPFFPVESQVYGGQDFPDGLIIVPLDSNFDAVNSQAVYLSGTRMPFMPFVFAGEQELKKTRPGGSNDPIIQVLGDNQEDVVITGEFSDFNYTLNPTGILDNISVGFVNYFEELRKSGKPLFISLQDRYTDSPNRFQYIRYGYLKRTEFSYKMISRIGYQMTFCILSDRKPFYNFFASSQVSEEVLNGALELSALAQKLEILPFDYPLAEPSLLDRLNNAINTVTSVIATVTKAIETLGNIATDLAAAVDQFIGIIDGAVASVARFKDDVTTLNSSISSIPDKTQQIESQAAINATTSLVNNPDQSFDDVGNGTTTTSPSTTNDSNNAVSAPTTTSTSKYFSNPNNQENSANQQAPSQSLTQSLLQIKTQFTDSVAAPDAIEHLVSSSDTLVSIAIRYYRDASKWTRILRQNNLSSITLVPGTVLKITPA